MPRFSNEERTLLIAMAEAFEASTQDPKVKGHLRQIIRKTRQSDDHHARKAAQENARKRA